MPFFGVEFYVLRNMWKYHMYQLLYTYFRPGKIKNERTNRTFNFCRNKFKPRFWMSVSINSSKLRRLSRDEQLGNKCAADCLTINQACITDCSADSTCILDCYLATESCITWCPCFQNCPSGCNECPYCSCSDPLSNPDYIECEERVFLLIRHLIQEIKNP